VNIDGGLLGCCSMQSFDCIPTFQRSKLPPSSGVKTLVICSATNQNTTIYIQVIVCGLAASLTGKGEVALCYIPSDWDVCRDNSVHRTL
jgi:hypothetical protein